MPVKKCTVNFIDNLTGVNQNFLKKGGESGSGVKLVVGESKYKK